MAAAQKSDHVIGEVVLVSDRPRLVAVFASSDWSDQARLRVWAKQRQSWAEACVILLTDDVTDANVVLARQLRCSNIMCALMRAGGTLRSPREFAAARARRDAAAMRMADEVVVFSTQADCDHWRNVVRDAVGLTKPITMYTP